MTETLVFVQVFVLCVIWFVTISSHASIAIPVPRSARSSSCASWRRAGAGDDGGDSNGGDGNIGMTSMGREGRRTRLLKRSAGGAQRNTVAGGSGRKSVRPMRAGPDSASAQSSHPSSE